MTNELFKFSKSKTKHAGKQAGKQAGKHLGGIQSEPCPVGACSKMKGHTKESSRSL